MNKYLIIGIAALVLLGLGYFIGVGSKKPDSEKAIGKPVVQSHRSYQMKVISDVKNVELNKPLTFTYTIINDLGETLKDFAVAHEKIMHLIVVRQDLAHFQHLHPKVSRETGEFTIEIVFPAAGPYRLFPDFTPAKEVNPQLLPVTVFSDIVVGDTASYTAQPITPDTADKKTSTGYSITYLFPKPAALTTQKEVTYSLLIEKDGQPVTDLENYLGAKGHSVIIKERTLDYIHTHALEEGVEITQPMHGGEHVSKRQEAGRLGNQIDFATTFPEKGLYKIFTQFQHQDKVITTDYVIQVN